VLPTHGAVHLGSGGVGLGRRRQERTGKRPQRAGWRGFGGAASLRGRSVAVVGPVAFGERSAFLVTASTRAGGRSRWPLPLPLRTAGVRIAVAPWAPDPTMSPGLRMVGLAADRFLQMVMVWVLPA
jgi:hypothetical protein